MLNRQRLLHLLKVVPFGLYLEGQLLVSKSPKSPRCSLSLQYLGLFALNVYRMIG